MALIEVEMVSARFGQLVHLLASAGPIPVGTLDALGPDQLISAVTWKAVEVSPPPGGLTPAAGTITARGELRVRHVSTIELDADPNAPGTEVAATAWLIISTSSTELGIDLVRVDVAGGVPQTLSPPVRVARRSVREVSDAGAIIAAAVLERDGVVTLRFATAAADAILATPLNVVTDAGGDWAIRVSGEALAQQLLNSLTDGVTPPPGGTVIEDPPTASWAGVGAAWGAVGNVGVEKIDACPGLFGSVDISVTANVVMLFTPDVSVTPPVLNLQVHVSSDASDWDSFRCWLGSGGIGSLLLGAITNPIVGILAGIGTLIAVGEIIRVKAGSEVTGGSLGAGLTKVSGDDTSATYTGTRPLPTLATTPGSSTDAATIGPLGLIVTGRILFLPATHAVAFNPDGGTLSANFAQSFSCNSRSWTRSVEVQSVQVTDRAQVFTTDLGAVPVRVFPTSSATPAHLWSIDALAPSFVQTVNIVGSAALQPGDAGRVYLHTSAGIRRYDIPALAPLPAPTPEEHIAAVARCLRFTRLFMPWEEIRWLIDPPPFLYGYPPLRQWLFTFAEVPAFTRMTFHRYQNGQRVGEPLSLIASRSGEAAFEIVTDAATEIAVEHNTERISRGRVNQRWLLPAHVVPVARPAALVRSGSKLVVVGRGELLSLDLSSGLVTRRVGELQLAKLADGLVVTETRRLFAGRQPDAPRRLPAAPASHPFSVTLADGKVAVTFEDQLVIGIPWGNLGIEPSRG